MAYSAKVGSFNLDTTKTAGQTQAITGVGFQAKIVLFWWSGSTATGDSVAGGTINIGFGAAIDSTHRFFVVTCSEDAQADSDAQRAQSVNYCIGAYTDTATVDGYADFASMNADGFTLTIDDQFTSALRVSYLALGGTDLTNVYVGNKQTPASFTGDYAITGVGFKPDALITASAIVGGATGAAAGGNLWLGLATGSSNLGVVGIYDQDAQVTSNTSGYGYNGEVCAGVTSATGVGYRQSFTSFDNDGFTLNFLESAAGQAYFHFICLKGGRYSVGDITTRTDGNDIAEAVGFQPTALLFASANRALSTQDAATAHARMSIGAATSASERACAAVSDEDNLADTETAYANYDTAVYANVVDDAAAGLMDIKSIDATGFTCVMDDTDPSAYWVAYLAIGARAGNPWYAYAQQ